MEIKDVENLASLARIELTLEEKNEILKDMEGILAYVGMIESVEVGDIEDSTTLKNVWREDVVDSEKYNAEKIKKQFPDAKDGFLKVKKIL